MIAAHLLTFTRPLGYVLASGLVLATAWTLVPGQAVSQETVAPQPSVLDSVSQEEVQRFCTSIADPARDQRYLLQKQELEKLQFDVDSRIAVLEERKAEYEDWLKRRNDFMKQAEGQLVEIYKKMPADAAAPQLQETDAILAAAIIMKLPPRQSSLILAEMEPTRAATVASIMSSAGDPNTSKDPT